MEGDLAEVADGGIRDDGVAQFVADDQQFVDPEASFEARVAAVLRQPDALVEFIELAAHAFSALRTVPAGSQVARHWHNVADQPLGQYHVHAAPIKYGSTPMLIDRLWPNRRRWCAAC